jgi:hypothetical protein
MALALGQIADRLVQYSNANIKIATPEAKF